MTKKILLIDDEEDLTDILSMRLMAEGYEVSTAKTGEEGLAGINHIRPDLILLDLVMPGLDGWEVCRRLRRNVKTRDVPIVILTAAQEKGQLEKVREEGATHLFLKPFEERELLALLKKVLE